MARTEKTIAMAAALAALAACQANVMQPRRAAPVRPAATTPVAAASTGLPAPTVAVPASVGSPAIAKLQRPPGNVVELAGSVTMDAAYAVRAGQGRVVDGLLSDHGAGVLALGGAAVITNNGATLISNNGGTVIAAADGNVIAPADASARHLLSDAAAAPAPTGVLPAAGALVQVFSLKRQQPLALGVDGQGRPVTAVYTNTTGSFRLYLPADETGNVLVQVHAPGATDTRLGYGLVTATSSTAAVDEDTDLVSRFLRTTFVDRMAAILAAPSPDAVVAVITNDANTQNPAARDLLRQIVIEINAAAVKDHVPPDATNPDVLALSRRMVDALMAYLGPPEDIKITKLMATAWTGPEEPALAAMADSLRSLREATAAKLASDPSYFQTHVFAFQGPGGSPIPAKIDVQKASDPGAYIVDNFLSKNELGGFVNIRQVFVDLGIRYDRDGMDHSDRLESASYAILGTIAFALGGSGPAHGAVLASLDAFAKDKGWAKP